MKQQEMILNDLADLKEIKKYAKVNLPKQEYEILSLERDNKGIVTMTAHKTSNVDDDKFGYTTTLNRLDIEKIKSLKYLGYFLNFDNKNRKVYLWLDNGKNIILKKGFMHSKTSGKLVSNLIAKLGSKEVSITELIEKAIQAERYGLLREANYLTH